ncbi:DUF126 domain-containing protein [Aminivibrio sp.]|jgi:hypothetical protein|uniref:aconitase X swivel domain-containing protein n=1 Tax=Aminivibrio sp. TaxID=1872489 RepID=UPI001A3EDCCA|nr:DUF126 domain-containing protein [Aminivibrio sp.]MBL3539199.1 DUF126 domain-containing protein [Aminivibrio sp.]
MAPERMVRCRRVNKGKGEGEVLLSKDAICFYLCDPETGVVIEEGHALHGKSVAGKILVVKSGKGSSVVMMDGLYQLKMRNNLPAAIIVDEVEPVLVSSCVVAGVPVVDRLEENPYTVLKDGDRVIVDADAETVLIETR